MRKRRYRHNAPQVFLASCSRATRVRANAPSRETRGAVFSARENERRARASCNHLRAVAPVQELELSIEWTSGSAVLTSLPVSSHQEESLYTVATVGGGGGECGEGWQRTTGSDCRCGWAKRAQKEPREKKGAKRDRRRRDGWYRRYTGIIYSVFILGRSPRRASDEYQAASVFATAVISLSWSPIVRSAETHELTFTNIRSSSSCLRFPRGFDFRASASVEACAFRVNYF